MDAVGSVIALIPTWLKAPPILALIAPLIKIWWDRYLIKRDKWKFPDIEVIGKLCADERLDGRFGHLAGQRYRVDAFFLLTAIRVKHPREIDFLLEFERRVEPTFYWPTIRSIYPMFLTPNDHEIDLTISRKQRWEHYGLYVGFAIMAFTVGVGLLSLISSPNLIAATITLVPPLFVALLLTLIADAPYKNAVKLKKNLSTSAEFGP